MKVGGWQKVSLIDYPEKVCTILFTQGCNFKCAYCHNPELVDPDLFQQSIPEHDIFSFLKRRKGKLDAVTITGGEPTIQADLAEFIQRIKEIGYLVKIDTNGSRPDMLQKLFDQNLLDYIAMDVKAPLEEYAKIAKSNVEPDQIKQSIETIMASGVPYEFRTTLVNGLLKEAELKRIVGFIKDARLYVLQRFVPSKSLKKTFSRQSTYSDEELATLRASLEGNVRHVVVR